MRPSYRHDPIHKKKSLGQVFLKADWPIKKMLDSIAKSGAQKVLEIGPGPGNLTLALIKAGLAVTAVEKDQRFVERLVNIKNLLPEEERQRLDIINADILKFDIQAWVKSSHNCGAIVGNIPYNISSPILIAVLPQLEKLKGLFFMTQLEFARRLVATPGSKDYGSLSVYCQLRSRVKLQCKVGRACFQPVPKVDSALISLYRSSDPNPQAVLTAVEKVTRTAFNQRRKTLRNSLANMLKGEDAGASPIDLQRRAETLTPEEFVRLAAYCQQLGSDH